MVSFNSWLDSLVAVGYNEPKARSRIAHDVVLMAMEKSGLARNVTIKGGVVMSDITDDVRRATMNDEQNQESCMKISTRRTRRRF